MSSLFFAKYFSTETTSFMILWVPQIQVFENFQIGESGALLWGQACLVLKKKCRHHFLHTVLVQIDTFHVPYLKFDFLNIFKLEESLYLILGAGVTRTYK